ncbi:MULTISPECIES: AraC family transcriptional regulator [unclassified Ensifer]|uniref:helix-turn-helix domain-containing protein n=1 Tax=unclassified Ensifer TaxID=2633371 RepID=UPI000813355D|nr:MULTISPECIES: AraC family transcriptional regulator [unclassified Ensifer]OCO99894.1 AraC family transcriptional regulator [Ensifer sp. LC13]OCP00165.1 AraC family transcriptional regulator [Ensifer sp. LC11]OCP03980.1 AraC family transcriptional regulator [Ensifer sp. LC14]OCP31056.1 AraC family transcriptional regulator [Ensifer sp. LC499]
MIFLPLPFVVALLLLILLVVMLRGDEPAKRNWAFLALVALCALQSVVVGLRWGYDVTALRFALPVLASGVPPLVLASFHSLIGCEERNVPGAAWVHATPTIGALMLVLLAPRYIDFALIVEYVGYALALLNLARPGTDALGEARFEGAVAAHRALVIAAFSLCLSALFDLAIILDFEWTKGANIGLIVSNANMLGLLFIGLTAMVADRARALPAVNAILDEEPTPEPQDREILDRIDHLLVSEKLARDENLTLSRLARRAGLPARQISTAVNRLAGKNVSQYINDFRIAEACRLLRETDMSVTSAMFESGFQTKSNFNREFRRVTALSPASWRQQSRAEKIAGSQ